MKIEIMNKFFDHLKSITILILHYYYYIDVLEFLNTLPHHNLPQYLNGSKIQSLYFNLYDSIQIQL